MEVRIFLMVSLCCLCVSWHLTSASEEALREGSGSRVETKAQGR